MSKRDPGLTLAESLDIWRDDIKPADGVERGAGRMVKSRPVRTVTLRTHGDARYSWLFFWPGDAAAMTICVHNGSQLLNGDGRYKRVVSVEQGVVRFVGEGREITLHETDRIWIPEGEVYSLESLSGNACIEMLVWRVPEGQSFQFFPLEPQLPRLMEGIAA